jgi:hypothetical protein
MSNRQGVGDILRGLPPPWLTTVNRARRKKKLEFGSRQTLQRQVPSMTTLHTFEQQLARATPEQLVAFVWSLCSGLQISTTDLLNQAQLIGDDQRREAANDAAEAGAALPPPADVSMHDCRLVAATICEVWSIRPSLLAQTASDVLHANPADYAVVHTCGYADDGFAAPDAGPVLQQAGEGAPLMVNRCAAQAAVAALFEPVLASPREPLDELSAIYHWSQHRMRRSRRTIFAQLAALLDMNEDELGDLIGRISQPERTPLDLPQADRAAIDMRRRASVLRFCQATSLSLEELGEFRRRPVPAHRPPPAFDAPCDHTPAGSGTAGAATPVTAGRPANKRRRHVVLSAGIMVSALLWLMNMTAT